MKRINIGDLVSVDELEREHARLVMEKTKDLAEAARVLGIDSATLYRKRKRWGYKIGGPRSDRFRSVGGDEAKARESGR